MPNARDSEVRAYSFIHEDLKRLGWNISNPGRTAMGQVYTQNEYRSHPELSEALGLECPENVVKISESIFWVIEAKAPRNQLQKAVGEAEYYAGKINTRRNIKALFISGVAGDQIDNYRVQTKFFNGSEFVPITVNDKPLTSLLPPGIARAVLDEGAALRDLPIDEELFLKTAEKINQILHLGAINKNARARVMAALLLALVDDANINVDSKPRTLISDVNTRAKAVLESHDKEAFLPFVNLILPASKDNHFKFKTALVQTLHELRNLNIRSAMNSSADVLGKFYEVFLKYGNGAKEIGIVLTPRHITKFSVDAIGIDSNDIVYDPACGTGGFLVAAFDQVRQNFAPAQVEKFRKYNIFGVDQDPDVVALSIVNMIFRGDGKTNIIEGSCFRKNLIREAGRTRVTYSDSPPNEQTSAVTRVLMNPPFALRQDDEKEFRFVEAALIQMQDGGLLFSVLPYGAMVKPGVYQQWRQDSLLAQNTLLSVVTFPDDLFYPVGVHTVGIFVRKGVPHPKKQNVLWIRGVNDGMLKSKGKRLPNASATNDYPAILDLVKAFIPNPKLPIPPRERFQKTCPIDFHDPMLELVPENYLDEGYPDDEAIRRGVEQVVRNTVAFLIQSGMERAV